MRFSTPLLLVATFGFALPAQAQPSSSTPTWSIVDEPLSCDLHGAMPSSSMFEEVRIHVPLDHRGISALSLFLPAGTEEAPASFFLGVNGTPALDGEISWFNGGPMERPEAWLNIKERRDIPRAMLDGAGGVLRVGAELIDLSTIGPVLNEARDCVRAIYDAAGVDMTQYPGSADMLVMRSEVWEKARSEGRSPTKTEMRSFRPIVGPSNYPAKALARGEEGTVRVALLVSERGKVEHCVVLQSASESLDEATCKSFKAHREFDVDVGPSGEPVPTLIVSAPIHWMLSR